MRIAIVARGISRRARPTGCAAPWRRSSASARSISFAEKFIEGMTRARLRREFAERLLRADRGLRRIRLSRKPRRELCQSGLCLGLDQMPLPRRVRGGAAQQPADGLLRAVADRARRAGARRRGAAGRCQSLGLGLHAGGRAATVRARRLASPPCLDMKRRLSAQRMRCGSASARSTDFPRDGARRSKACAARASIPSAISGCARGCRRRRWNGSRTPMPSARSGSTAAMRYGRCGAAPLRRQGRSAAVRARRHARARAGRAFAADAAGPAGDRGLSPSAPVA